MKPLHFTALSAQYDPLYIVAEPHQFRYINVNKSLLYYRLINLSEVTHIQFTIHNDILFRLKDFEMDQIQFKSVFYHQIMHYLGYNKQEVQNLVFFDLAAQFLILNDVEIQLGSNRFRFELSDSESPIFKMQIGYRNLQFDFQDCRVLYLERQQFILQDRTKKIKFQSLESFDKSLLLEYFFKSKVLYYQTYTRQYNVNNELLYTQTERKMREQYGLQNMDFSEEPKPKPAYKVASELNPQLEYKRAVRYLQLLIQDIRESQNRGLGGVLQELLVLEGKLLVEQTKKQQGQADMWKEIDGALSGVSADMTGEKRRDANQRKAQSKRSASEESASEKSDGYSYVYDDQGSDRSASQ